MLLSYKSVMRILVSSLAGAFVLSFSGVVLAAHYDHRTKGYSVDYPDSWNLNLRMMEHDGPLTLTNFPAGEYRHGGLLPPGGIEITMLALPSTMDENFMLVPDGTATNVKRSVRSVNGRGILRADYDAASFDAKNPTHRVTSICFRVGGRLFRIMVQYEHPRPDLHETAATERALAEMIGSVASKEAK